MLKMPRTRKTDGMTSALDSGGPPGIGGASVALPGLSVTSRIAIAMVAAVMGMLLVFGAGFANSQLLHDAAHDARHGLGFPCH